MPICQQATVHKCAKGYQQPCSKWSGKAWVADPKWKPRVTGQDLDHGYTVKMADGSAVASCAMRARSLDPNLNCH